MTDKERLEEIKEKYSKANVIEHLNGIDIIAVAKKDILWLIQQSELMQHFARKNTELNVFLNKYSEPKHLGKNVIDVAMDIIGEQAERVQELGEDLLELVKQNKELRKSIAFYSSESYNAHLERLLDRSEKQNKRYREALEFYAGGKHVAYKLDETDDDLVVDYGEKARKALEGESDA